jgi:predicted nucleic acid-binding protein
MRTPALCLDANVFVSALMPHEREHEDALCLLETVQEQGWALFEPAILPSEVVSNIHRKFMEGDISEHQREKAAELFFQLPLLLQWKPALMIQAIRIASELSLRRIYDCTYVAVAMKKRIPLVTLDRELLEKGKAVYPSLHTVEGFLKSVSKL